MPKLNWLELFNWQDIADIATVTVLAWVAIRYLRQTRARAALVGLAVLGLVYAVATQLELRVTASLFQASFAGLVLVVVVVFQEDLRRLFEQVGSWRPGRKAEPIRRNSRPAMIRAIATLASQRMGALIVLPHTEPLARHIDGGITLNGRLSEPLLLSIFDSSSPGHDGAVIVRGNQVERFAVHLPLSTNQEALGARGTRHAAGLGISERCDATAIIVSEERGTISLADNGELRVVSVSELADFLSRDDEEKPTTFFTWSRTGATEAIGALAAAMLAWLIFVPGSDISEMTVEVPVSVANLPEDLALEAIEPAYVSVTLQGLRRDLVLLDPNTLEIAVDGYLTRFGRRTFSISEDEVQTPDALSVALIDPEKVKLSLRQTTAEQAR